MPDQSDQSLKERLVAAYNSLLDTTREVIREERQDFNSGIDLALEKVSELEELSREELNKAADYLKRDVEDAANYLNTSGKEMRDWLQIDLELIERGLAEKFNALVDHTREQLLRLEIEADLYGEWHTGEVTGLGTLECKSCGEQLHFHKPGHIPPCPKCHGTTFRRLNHEG
jgi:hypothetical protein